jgi:sugar phosphate isomerase/epimerase
MKLAFSTLGCPKWTLQQIVENAAVMGFHGVDLRGVQDQIDVTGLPAFTTHLASTKQLFADNGVEIAGVYSSAHLAVVDKEKKQLQFDETRRNLELAAKVGAPIVRVFGGRIPDGYTVETIIPYIAENLRQLGNEAQAVGVKLVLETHDAWTDSGIVRRLLEETNHPYVKVLWDLHHPYRMTGEPIETAFENLKAYTERIHVKDSKLNADGTYTYCLQGAGDVPLKKGLDLLREYGYDGYATLEWEQRWHPELPDPEIAFPQYVQKMREWLGSTLATSAS